MVKTRRICLLSKSADKLQELDVSLSKYGVESFRVDPVFDSAENGREEETRTKQIRDLLLESDSTRWVKAVFKEEMKLCKAECPTEVAELVDCEPVIAMSTLHVWTLSSDQQARIRESKAYSTSLVHPGTMREEETAGGSPLTAGPEPALMHSKWESSVEGYIDLSRRAVSLEGVFGWDDIFVVRNTSLSFQEMRRLGHKVSPRDNNFNQYVIQHLHYQQRKHTNFINPNGQDETISFKEQTSVGAFIQTNEFMNNSVAVETGLRDVFVAVANNGAFFRSAKTRREVNYWLPGLNAGIPFVAKKDPIHEITFTAHDFGHFLIPDLVYTGGTSQNYKRTYIMYRMMSEATTLVFADMLFVETLRLCGKYDYDWARRKIHPLFQDTGIKPFEEGSRETFFGAFRQLLEANVAYCLLGDDSSWKGLIERARGGALEGGTCPSIESFKDKYMPFFVEDYKWTSANYQNMAKDAEVFSRWWGMVAPIVSAAGLDSMANGIGLETVEQHMAAIGVTDASPIAPKELIEKIFNRTFETRIKPIFETPGGYALASPEVRLRNAFTRYLVGQFIIFARFHFIPQSKIYADKITQFMVSNMDSLDEAKVNTVRALYRSYLRHLHNLSLLTTDDVVNFGEVCPLFDPVYVFYDESKDFYSNLSEVQAQILSD
ncbi:hypothetical protein CYMTET_7851 [Cymbomonas tetramitiformis]|uniref:Uncharacterized protein n=1 Tax=Cymbomonas tetramitiformis TaxID=36881 RepID=A0AAE0GUN4_9CHLO|nr:hypothetical protein CYMTET_10052 [Cymbomonas tetramitiformis]KAK3284503.1 hypothetical protein CYMTET_7851 [Cymbomonas tetramitiformis]